MAGSPLTPGEVDRIVREVLDRHPVMVQVRQLQTYVRWGAGTPEGVTDAPMGALYSRTDTGQVYRKTTPAGATTGWTTNFP